MCLSNEAMRMYVAALLDPKSLRPASDIVMDVMGLFVWSVEVDEWWLAVEVFDGVFGRCFDEKVDCW